MFLARCKKAAAWRWHADPLGHDNAGWRGENLPRAALIIVDSKAPRLFGFAWAELMIRRLQRIGVAQTVVVASRIPAALVTVLDRLRRDGMAVAMIRDAAQAADLFHPDEDVLLFSGMHLASDALIDSLLAAPSPAIACVAAQAGERFERIDAETRWAGYAIVDGATVRATAAIVGDWDLASTLLRAAVQASAARIVACPPPHDANDAVEVSVAARALLDEPAPRPGGWATRLLVAPLARVLAFAGRRQAASIVTFGPWVATALAVLGVSFAIYDWPAIATGTLLAAELTHATDDRWARIIGRSERRNVRQRYLLDGCGATALLAIAAQANGRHLLIALALVVIAQMVLLLRLPDGVRTAGMADVPGNTLLLLVGCCFGEVGIVAAVATMAIHAFASVAAGQNSLSRVLTSPR